MIDIEAAADKHVARHVRLYGLDYKQARALRAEYVAAMRARGHQ